MAMPLSDPRCCVSFRFSPLQQLSSVNHREAAPAGWWKQVFCNPVRPSTARPCSKRRLLKAPGSHWGKNKLLQAFIDEKVQQTCWGRVLAQLVFTAAGWAEEMDKLDYNGSKRMKKHFQEIWADSQRSDQRWKWASAKLKVTSWTLRWFHPYEMEGKCNVCRSEAGQQGLAQRRRPRHPWRLKRSDTFNSRGGRNSATVAWILHQSSERIAPAGGGERLVKDGKKAAQSRSLCRNTPPQVYFPFWWSVYRLGEYSE